MITKHPTECSLQSFTQILSTLARQNKAPEAGAVA
jgi:hypothetical protein